MSFNIGENVGPYRILEQLGQGGMATVFKAYHASLDRYVALKVLHPAFNQDQSFISRFQREARVKRRPPPGSTTRTSFPFTIIPNTKRVLIW